MLPGRGGGIVKIKVHEKRNANEHAAESEEKHAERKELGEEGFRRRIWPEVHY